MSDRLSIGSVCSGSGACLYGTQLALGPMDVKFVADIEKAPVKVLSYRFPFARQLGDISKADWTTVPRVDVLTGGTPCQDLSIAGQRAGMAPGTRSGLWTSMRDAVDVLRPRLVVWENVAGARSAKAARRVESGDGCVAEGDRPQLRALGRVLGDLAYLGYDAQWHSVRASSVGAPHRRERVFVIAFPSELGAPDWDLRVEPPAPMPDRLLYNTLTLYDSDPPCPSYARRKSPRCVIESPSQNGCGPVRKQSGCGKAFSAGRFPTSQSSATPGRYV